MPSFHDFGSIGKNPRRLERLEQGLKIIGDLRKLLSKKEKVLANGTARESRFESWGH